MDKKPELKIDTEFYNEEQPFQPQSGQINALIETPQNLDEKSAAAAMFQRLFSANLAGKFISCWHSLKEHGKQQGVMNSRNYMNLNNHNHHNTHQQHINSGQYYAFQKSDYSRQYEPNYGYQQNFYKLNILRSPKDILNIQSLKQSQHKSDRESESQSRRNHQTHIRNDLYYDGHQIDRDQHIVKHQTHQKFQRNNSRNRLNKSQDRIYSRSRRRLRDTEYFQQKRLKRCSSADLRTQVSRANILNQIAQKLRQSKTHITHQGVDTEVINRLSKLERLMHDIRTTNERANQNNIRSSTRFSPKQAQREKVQISKMLQQIYGLKRQLSTIKHYNQQILKNDVSKSVVRSNNFYEINKGASSIQSSVPIGITALSNLNQHDISSQLYSQTPKIQFQSVRQSVHRPQFTNSVQIIQRKQFNYLPAPSLMQNANTRQTNVNNRQKPFQSLNSSSNVNISGGFYNYPTTNTSNVQQYQKASFNIPQPITASNQSSVTWNHIHNTSQNNNNQRLSNSSQTYGHFGNRMIGNLPGSQNRCPTCGRNYNR